MIRHLFTVRASERVKTTSASNKTSSERHAYTTSIIAATTATMNRFITRTPNNNSQRLVKGPAGNTLMVI